MNYEYKAVVTKVYDGDTITVEIDLGFDIKTTQRIRLLGIDTPEIRGEEHDAGIAARDWLRWEILDQTVVLKTLKDRKGKYGRYLGTVLLDGVNMNDKLIEVGHAAPYGAKK